MNQNPPPPPSISPFYYLQTALKVAFLPMSLFNLRFTLIVALAASVMALLRVLKKPQFNQQYLARVLMNNHGQNILYIVLGSLGFINYLYYSPIVLFFCFNLSEFLKIRFPALNYNAMYGDQIRRNKFYIFQGKSRLQIAFLFYCVVTLPLDFFQRAIKVFVVGQFLMVKYRMSHESRQSWRIINAWIDQKTSSIGVVNRGYKKIANWAYEFATRDPRAQAPEAQPNQ